MACSTMKRWRSCEACLASLARRSAGVSAGWTESTVGFVDAVWCYWAWQIEIWSIRASRICICSKCSMKCLDAFLLISLSIQAGTDFFQLALVKNTAMKMLARTVCWFDAEFKKSPFGSTGLYYANELALGVLVRRMLGTKIGRTAPADVTLGTPWSYSSWKFGVWIIRDVVSNACTICSEKGLEESEDF